MTFGGKTLSDIKQKLVINLKELRKVT